LEDLLIPAHDLEVLRTFNGHGSTTLTAYLRLDSPEHQLTAYDEFVERVQRQLDECDFPQECREALKEDIEIIGIYLRTNGRRAQPAVAIFSCAAELFWRVYPLPLALPSQVSIGPQFDVEPLTQVAYDAT
jgi:hypothetical protein